MLLGEYPVNFINRDSLLKRRGDKIWMGLAAWLMALSTVWFSRTVRCNHMTESLLVLLPCVCPLNEHWIHDRHILYIHTLYESGPQGIQYWVDTFK